MIHVGVACPLAGHLCLHPFYMLKRRIHTQIIILAWCLAAAACTATPPPPPADLSPGPSSTWAWPSAPPTHPTAAPSTPLRLPTLDPSTWASWAVVDRRTAITVHGGAAGTSTTESMIKIGVVAQYLADLEEVGRTPTQNELDLMSAAIIDSDNEATENLYRKRFGDMMIRKLLAACRLTETTTKPGWWAETQMTAADAARMGACIAAGHVASTEWTTWILGQMRSVRGEGRFGIIDAYPHDDGQPLAIKNGWTVRADGWHVNCLAVATRWTIAVMIRYPAGRGLGHGAAVCRDIAAALVVAETPTPPAATA